MSVAGLSSCHSTCLFPCLYPSLCLFIPCLFPLFTLFVCYFACHLSVRLYNPLPVCPLSVPKSILFSVFSACLSPLLTVWLSAYPTVSVTLSFLCLHVCPSLSCSVKTPVTFGLHVCSLSVPFVSLSVILPVCPSAFYLSVPLPSTCLSLCLLPVCPYACHILPFCPSNSICSPIPLWGSLSLCTGCVCLCFVFLSTFLLVARPVLLSVYLPFPLPVLSFTKY